MQVIIHVKLDASSVHVVDKKAITIKYKNIDPQ